MNKRKIQNFSDEALAVYSASLSEDNVNDWDKIDAVKYEQKRRAENEIEGVEFGP